ncbi:MAG: DUF1674 domain-containing protein [Gammaproteobacteria bacterium TMED183]|jgi:hypothetical protein|nr:MAG: DUF1674 domain-containing protein [Gammaproteobacteria bacterium TMED183]|tara:strand:- start:900 stop:1079 length:180 start_codon:yes stop_codon:yes gene_type:complete
MENENKTGPDADITQDQAKPETGTQAAETPPMPPERGGPKGPEPTRYGDWEKGGRCTDF